MRILAIDAALSCYSVALVANDAVVAVRQETGGRGHAAALAPMVDAVIDGHDIDGVAVTVGPGSFTGLRAAIALAQGMAAGAGVPLAGVTVAEAIAAAFPAGGRRELWVAIDSRRGRVFLDRAGTLAVFALDELPVATKPVVVAGDAAPGVASRLAARGVDVMLTDMRMPPIRWVGIVGARRIRGEIAAIAALPVYVDPPEAKLPAGGLRPAPI